MKETSAIGVISDFAARNKCKWTPVSFLFVGGFYKSLQISEDGLCCSPAASVSVHFSLAYNFGVTGSLIGLGVGLKHYSSSYTVWAGTLCGNGKAVLGSGGFALAPNASTQFSAPPGWSGRFWARTDCNFDGTSNGICVTGDCGGKLQCTGCGVPPATLAEFTIGSTSNTMDFYDVSLVDGYNVGIGIQTSGGTGDCRYAGCIADLNKNCPPELQVINNGSVVACKSACAAFGTPQYCCSGPCNTPATCSPTYYSELFKKACPDAYSYAYDDATSTFTCIGADYLIMFCPSG